MFGDLTTLWSSPVISLLFLAGLVWVTYGDVLQGVFVSDDVQGIAIYDGKLQRPVSYGNLFKKFRYEFGKIPNPDHEWAAKKLPEFLAHPKRHHRLNLWLMCGVAGLLYSFLSRLVNPQVAFLTTLLFIVHPIGVQTVGWISGVVYVMAAFWMLLGFNLAFLFQDLGWWNHPMGVLGGVLIIGTCQWLAVEAQFATLGAVVIFFWLKMYPLAVVAGLLSIYSGLNTFRAAISLRRAVFKEQRMERSTQFYPRKLITVLKTLAYYTRFICWPKRMGLYHSYQYHYEVPYSEVEDPYFWCGLLFVFGYGWFIFTGPPLVQFTLLWLLAYLVTFLNWITANQFVAERYAWLSSVSVCFLVALYAPAWLICFLGGLALMRTWAHLPTYYNETQFYQSNIWNFPGNEVAIGNLGVVYLSRGLIGMASDCWTVGTQINPQYDVNWYNLSSMIRSRGLINPNYFPLLYNMAPDAVKQVIVTDPMRGYIHLAKMCLERAIGSKTCHFPEPWKKELEEVNKVLSAPVVATSVPIVTQAT